MAIAKKCDRCGAFYSIVDESAIEAMVQAIYNLAKKQSQLNFETIISKIDLCPDCRKSLIEWFENNTGGDNG